MSGPNFKKVPSALTHPIAAGEPQSQKTVYTTHVDGLAALASRCGCLRAEAHFESRGASKKKHIEFFPRRCLGPPTVLRDKSGTIAKRPQLRQQRQAKCDRCGVIGQHVRGSGKQASCPVLLIEPREIGTV
jgi:hypothetical protein